MLGPPPRIEGAELSPQLLTAARAGQARARQAFVVHYQDRVFRLLRRIVSPRGQHDALVEDLAQDAFVRALAALPGFDPAGSARLSTWVLTIATRVALDAMRQASRRPATVLADDDLPDPMGASHAPERRLLASVLRRAVATLSPSQRAVFVLREYDGLSYREIGEALGVAPGTVASRLARAKAELRAALDGGTA